MSDSENLREVKRLFQKFWADEQEREVQTNFNMFGEVEYDDSTVVVCDGQHHGQVEVQINVDTSEKAFLVMKAIHEILMEVG